jgi:hypothetical protein
MRKMISQGLQPICHRFWELNMDIDPVLYSFDVAALPA